LNRRFASAEPDSKRNRTSKGRLSAKAVPSSLLASNASATGLADAKSLAALRKALASE
jgi:hypothetical protein